MFDVHNTLVPATNNVTYIYKGHNSFPSQYISDLLVCKTIRMCKMNAGTSIFDVVITTNHSQTKGFFVL
jgi:hypothetical protein